MVNDFILLEQFVILWARDRNLLRSDNDRNQLLKTVEELGEVARAVLKQDEAGIKDGIGDVLVTLAIFAATHNLNLTECLQAAWNEIKDRKGSTVNGTFIKDES